MKKNKDLKKLALMGLASSLLLGAQAAPNLSSTAGVTPGAQSGCKNYSGCKSSYSGCKNYSGCKSSSQQTSDTTWLRDTDAKCGTDSCDSEDIVDSSTKKASLKAKRSGL